VTFLDVREQTDQNTPRESPSGCTSSGKPPREIPVVAAQVVLEITGYPDRGKMRVHAGRKEESEPKRPLIDTPQFHRPRTVSRRSARP
jgi:hypothetical protein